MLYAVICRDKPGHLQLRIDTRERHLEHIRSTGIVLQAGPFIENGEMCGTLAVLDTDSLEAAQEWAAKDPYAIAGLFESVSVTEWKKVIG
ncbi:YciI family protein [Albirhodobacter sp. R86504]|jgi:uncharacterized protein YciI|uniref:YciI family protein n=1 Tax=Albirhodobacter sp. R86504 TaxID=3093848 RepID=UPI00367093B3